MYFDYGMSRQAEDEEIYQKAIEHERFVLTVNLKDFRKLVKTNNPGVIGIESQLSNQEIDRLVTDFVMKNNHARCMGKTFRIIEP